MKRKIVSLLIVLVMLASFSPLICSAQIVDEGECGENLTWTLDSEGTLTISGTGEMYSVSAFSSEPCIKKVIIEYGMTSINPAAFENCWDLTEIIIPNSVISIGNGAFSNCDALEKITIPDSVTSIEAYTFSYCRSLKEIIIPDSVISIGDKAFYGCSALKKIVIPDSVTHMGEDVIDGTAYYYDLSNYINGLLYINNHLMAIDNSIFQGSLNVIQGTVTISGRFHNRYLTNVTIPDSVVHIQNDAFANCKSISDINVAEGNRNYMSQDGILFDKNMNTLMRYPTTKKDFSYVIPDSVNSVNDKAFANNLHLTYVTVPESVSTIGSHAFENCSSLTSINVSQNNTEYTSEDGVLFNKDKWTLIKYPEGKKGAYTIPDGVKMIESCAFNKCEFLTKITAPDSVKDLGGSTFWGCIKLRTAVLNGNSFDEFNNTFMGCSSLKALYIRYIDATSRYFLLNCDSLTDIYCYSIDSEDIPEGVKVHTGTDGIPVPKILDTTAVTENVENDTYSYTFNIDLSDVPYNCSLVTAVYADDVVTGTSVTPINSDTVSETVTITAKNRADSAKVFIWDDMSNLEPLCEAVSPEITANNLLSN